MSRKAIIVGAGPAGLTAAYELLTKSDIIPMILEKSGEIGGISKTTNYKGNRMDMGPHRFFSKSDRVMDWWLKMLPLEDSSTKGTTISYQKKSRNITAPNAAFDGRAKGGDNVMLVIRRLTRIYFLRRFFAYPIQLSLDSLRTLGLIRTIKIILSFLWIRLFPRTPEKNLEDFIINRFGRQLYLLFFKDYTEKVWGVAPVNIPAEWGIQRIKGISLAKAITSALKSIRGNKIGNDIHQKDLETSLIEQFLYPKYGPGSIWEEAARKIVEMGGKVYLHQDVRQIYTGEDNVQSVVTVNSLTGQTGAWQGDYFFSTMPVQDLIAGMGSEVPAQVRQIAAGLQYRDFINVGVLLTQLSDKAGRRLDLKDNWIYIQERDVKVGRLMIYNNWGGGMVKDPGTTWIGMEYFCNKEDDFWAQPDAAIQRLAIAELQKMDMARPEDILDSTIQRMEKTYPAYFGTYDEFEQVRLYTDNFKNLFLIGRNGMHKYNNADHSMLTAMVAVDNIIAGETSKANIWSINTEQEYHEVKHVGEVGNKMPPATSAAPIQYPFLVGYLWNNRTNRMWWVAAFSIFVIQLIVFKFRYPFANYMPDSYGYLEAAANNADVNMWPVAYSKFLRLISAFTHSDKLLVGLQYLFLQGSSLILVFTLLHWLKPGRGVKTFLLVFFLFNPLPLYIANYISADALFIGLSLLWLTSLIWIIYKPRPWIILVHGALLVATFTVRYNAIYYPFISLAVFILSPQSRKMKLAGMTFAFGLVLGSFFYTSKKMKEATGTWQFSPFGGWQLANNALYMYQHVPVNERRPVQPRFSLLESMVRQHLDTLARIKFSSDDSLNAYFYLWNRQGPLIQYFNRQFEGDTAKPYFNRWATMGPLYKDYALQLIRQYPEYYLQAFVLPNVLKYLAPPTEFLGSYNMGQDSVGKLAKDWFNYASQRVSKDNHSRRIILATAWYPLLLTLVNALYILSLVGLLMYRKREPAINHMMLITLALWLMNFGFSIVASPIVLRYEITSGLVCLIFCLIFSERIYLYGIAGEKNLKNLSYADAKDSY